MYRIAFTFVQADEMKISGFVVEFIVSLARVDKSTFVP